MQREMIETKEEKQETTTNGALTREMLQAELGRRTAALIDKSIDEKKQAVDFFNSLQREAFGWLTLCEENLGNECALVNFVQGALEFSSKKNIVSHVLIGGRHQSYAFNSENMRLILSALAQGRGIHLTFLSINPYACPAENFPWAELLEIVKNTSIKVLVLPPHLWTDCIHFKKFIEEVYFSKSGLTIIASARSEFDYSNQFFSKKYGINGEVEKLDQYGETIKGLYSEEKNCCYLTTAINFGDASERKLAIPTAQLDIVNFIFDPIRTGVFSTLKFFMDAPPGIVPIIFAYASLNMTCKLANPLVNTWVVRETTKKDSIMEKLQRNLETEESLINPRIKAGEAKKSSASSSSSSFSSPSVTEAGVFGATAGITRVDLITYILDKIAEILPSTEEKPGEEKESKAERKPTTEQEIFYSTLRKILAPRNTQPVSVSDNSILLTIKKLIERDKIKEFAKTDPLFKKMQGRLNEINSYNTNLTPGIVFIDVKNGKRDGFPYGLIGGQKVELENDISRYAQCSRK